MFGSHQIIQLALQMVWLACILRLQHAVGLQTWHASRSSLSTSSGRVGYPSHVQQQQQHVFYG